MCTVSALFGPGLSQGRDRHADGPLRLRVVCNRDERRTRAAARPPVTGSTGGLRIAYPVDPDGGGTWVAATSAGRVLALLNVNDGPSPARAPGPSRGGIIPAVAAAPTLDACARQVRALAAQGYPPFRLLIVEPGGGVEIVARNGRTRVRRLAAGEPAVRSSSSLGDALVTGARRALFRRLVAAAPPTERIAAQDAFHAHAWPGRGAQSVRMSRADACTVSETTVEVRRRAVLVCYRPLAPEGLPRTVRLAFET